MAGWGDLAGKVAQQFQSRVERLKNEKATIEKRLKVLENGDCTDASATEASKLVNRLDEIKNILANNAKD